MVSSHPQWWWISERNTYNWLMPHPWGPLPPSIFLFFPRLLLERQLLPDLWTLTDSTRVFLVCGLSPLPSSVNSSLVFGGPEAHEQMQNLHVIQCKLMRLLPLGFHRHCSEVIAQVNRQENIYLPIGASGELCGPDSGPSPVAGSALRAVDLFTKQLISSHSLLAPFTSLEKSLRFTSTQPLSFPSCWCPAFRKEETRHPLSLTDTPRGVFLLALASGDVSLEILQVKGCCALPSSQEEAGVTSTL